MHRYDAQVWREHERSDIGRTLSIEISMIAVRKEVVDCKNERAHQEAEVGDDAK